MYNGGYGGIERAEEEEEVAVSWPCCGVDREVERMKRQVVEMIGVSRGGRNRGGEGRLFSFLLCCLTNRLRGGCDAIARMRRAASALHSSLRRNHRKPPSPLLQYAQVCAPFGFREAVTMLRYGWKSAPRTYLTKREAREKVVFDREQVRTQGNQRMSLSHLLQLERVKVPLVHLLLYVGQEGNGLVQEVHFNQRTAAISLGVDCTA